MLLQGGAKDIDTLPGQALNNSHMISSDLSQVRDVPAMVQVRR